MAECKENCESCNEECNHDCEHCSHHEQEIQPATPLQDTKIKKIIGVFSGKGGVGKSMVSSLLAIELAKKGHSVGIMDADITGPSIPKMFGLGKELFGDEEGIFPAQTPLGIKVVSVNMMLEDEEQPVLWRGPVLGGIIKQFYCEVHWGELDYLIVDMPPGTSDVAISLIQELPIDGFVMVTSPSKLVSMVVAKAINMAKQVNKEIFALIENMSYVKCDACGHDINIYANDETANVAQKYGLEILGKLPIDPILANSADEGLIENYQDNYLSELVKKIEK